eukprot:COSAG05_NODE_473_length_9490_cov_16.326696_8_plen_144_part_00
MNDRGGGRACVHGSWHAASDAGAAGGRRRRSSTPDARRGCDRDARRQALLAQTGPANVVMSLTTPLNASAAPRLSQKTQSGIELDASGFGERNIGYVGGLSLLWNNVSRFATVDTAVCPAKTVFGPVARRLRAQRWSHYRRSI